MASNYGRKSVSSGSRRARASSGPASGGPSRRAPVAMPRNRTSASGKRVGPGVGSESLGDVRGARTARMQSRYNRYVRRIVAVVAAIVAAVLLYAVLYAAGAFPVTQVVVRGSEHMTNEEVSQAAAIPADATLLRLDTAGVVSRLESQAWIEDAAVTLIPMGTVQLDIRERTIKAVVQVPSKDGSVLEDWAIASDGVWLMRIPASESEEASLVNPNVYADAERALHITEVPYGVEPVVGETCSDANVNNALDIISGLSDELASQVTAVEASGAETATLTLSNGVQIAFGDAQDVRDKERIVNQLMQEYQDQIAYINVRSPNRPTWRALES